MIQNKLLLVHGLKTDCLGLSSAREHGKNSLWPKHEEMRWINVLKGSQLFDNVQFVATHC